MMITRVDEGHVMHDLLGSTRNFLVPVLSCAALAAILVALTGALAHADERNSNRGHVQRGQHERARPQIINRDWRQHETHAYRYWHQQNYVEQPNYIYAPPVIYYPPPAYQEPGFNLIIPLNIH